MLVVICADMPSYNDFTRRVLANEHNMRFRTNFNLVRVKYETKLPLGE